MFGEGQDLEGGLEQDAERTERAGHESEGVEPGHVLHHFSAEAQQAPFTREAAYSEQMIAHRAGVGAARAGDPAGDGTAQ